MKKITLLFFGMLHFTLSSQVVSSVDFHVLNDNMEDSYIELEKIWSEFHKNNMERGKMIRWVMLKVESSEGGPSDVANYVTVNTYGSIKDYNSIWDNINPDSFSKIVKKRLKGKMSSRTVNKILNAEIKKSHRSYMITPLDGTAPPPKLKEGDVILLDAMSQKNDDYEQYESSLAKNVMQYNVDNGNLKLWGFTKIIDRNEAAAKGPTHFTWRVPVEGGDFQWEKEELYEKFGNKFLYQKMWELASASRSIPGSASLRIVQIIEKQ
jgi:hypothetical protein